MSSLYAAVEPVARLRSLSETTGKDTHLLPNQYDDLVEYLRAVGAMQIQNIRETRQDELVEWSRLDRVKYCDCRLCKHQWEDTRTPSGTNFLVAKTLVRSVARPAGRRGGATVRTRSPMVVICTCDNPNDRTGAGQMYVASGIFLPYSMSPRDGGCEGVDEPNHDDKEVDYFLLLYHDPQMQRSDKEHPGRLFNPWLGKSAPTGGSIEVDSPSSQAFDDLLLWDTVNGANLPSDLAWPEAYSITQSLLFYAHAIDYTCPSTPTMNVRSPLGPQAATMKGLRRATLRIDPAISHPQPLGGNALHSTDHAQPLTRTRRYAFLGFPSDGKATLVRNYPKFFIEVESMRDWFSSLTESERIAVFFTLLQQKNTAQTGHQPPVRATAAVGTRNEHFSEDVGAVDQWFKVLAPDHRTAVLHAFKEEAGDVQQRFFARALG